MPRATLNVLLTALLLLNTAGFLLLSYALQKQVPLGPPVLGPSSYFLAMLWLFTFGVLLWWARRRDTATSRQERSLFQSLRASVGDPQVQIIAGTLLLAFVFRSAELERLPWGYAGIHIDAAYNTEVAFRILDGGEFFTPVTPSIAYFRDTLTHYYLAMFYGLFGRTIETLRFACNVLGLLNCLLLFFILRNYTVSSLAITGSILLYAFSGADTIFAISGIEYIMPTPFMLGSFLLFTRAIRGGRLIDATLAGFLWGVGFSSHYSYLYLGTTIPIIAVFHFRVVSPWLPTFLLGGFLGALPKVSYLFFNYERYLHRISDVSKHDASGNIFVLGSFWNNIKGLGPLLFQRQIDLKWLLPEDPLIPPVYIPLLVLGLGVALVRFRRPEHLMMIVVTTLTIVANIFAYTVDYRFTNWMPILFLALGIGLSKVEDFAVDKKRVRFALGLLVALLLVKSMGAYFSHNDNPRLRYHYRPEEVALAKSLRGIDPSGVFYVLGPDLTWRLEFFNLENPDIRRLNYFLDRETQLRYSISGESIIRSNLEFAMRQSANPSSLNVIISPESPYGETLSQYLVKRLAALVSSLKVSDPVTRKESTYYWIRIPSYAKGPVQLAKDLTRKFESPGLSAVDEKRGNLTLTTFADTEQSLITDRREVAAILDLDFKTKIPYPGNWGAKFSLKWAGFLYVENSGEHTVQASFDDGCRIRLDDRLLFADWVAGPSRSRSVVINLERGWHRIEIDYFQFIFDAKLSFSMAPAARTLAPVAGNLFASEAIDSRILEAPSLSFGEGMKLFDKGEYERAQNYFHHVLKAFPHSPNADSANYFFAICYFKRQRWDETIRSFNKLIHNYPKSNFVAEAFYHIGWCQHLKGERSKALESFRLVTRRFPNSRWRRYAEDWIKTLEKN